MNTNEPPKLRKILDTNLKQAIMEMDHELRANVRFVNGKHEIVKKQPGMSYSKNGLVCMEKLGVVTARGTKIDLMMYLNNGNDPEHSNAYWWYYTADGARKKSGNSIFVCNTQKEGRNAYFNQKVDWRPVTKAEPATPAQNPETPAPQPMVASSRKMW